MAAGIGVVVGFTVGVAVGVGSGVGKAVAVGETSAATLLCTVAGSSVFEQPTPMAISRASRPYIAFRLIPLRPLGHSSQIGDADASPKELFYLADRRSVKGSQTAVFGRLRM
jgi:hypothetical protein